MKVVSKRVLQRTIRKDNAVTLMNYRLDDDNVDILNDETLYELRLFNCKLPKSKYICNEHIKKLIVRKVDDNPSTLENIPVLSMKNLVHLTIDIYDLEILATIAPNLYTLSNLNVINMFINMSDIPNGKEMPRPVFPANINSLLIDFIGRTAKHEMFFGNMSKLTKLLSLHLHGMIVNKKLYESIASCTNLMSLDVRWNTMQHLTCDSRQPCLSIKDLPHLRDLYASQLFLEHNKKWLLGCHMLRIMCVIGYDDDKYTAVSDFVERDMLRYLCVEGYLCSKMIVEELRESVFTTRKLLEVELDFHMPYPLDSYDLDLLICMNENEKAIQKHTKTNTKNMRRQRKLMAMHLVFLKICYSYQSITGSYSLYDLPLEMMFEIALHMDTQWICCGRRMFARKIRFFFNEKKKTNKRAINTR